MDRIKRRIFRFYRWVPILLVLSAMLFVSAVLLIRLPAVQSRIVSSAVSYVYDRWGVQIELHRLFVGFTGSLELDGLVVYDRDCDTLAALKGLSADISFYNMYAQRLLFDAIELDSPYLKLYYDSLQDVNIEYLIDMFPGSDTSASADSSSFYIKSYHLAITGGRFGFDCRHLDTASGMHYVCPTQISDLTLRADNVVFSGGKISFAIDTLAFFDAGRLSQVGLSGTGYVSDGTIALSPLSITTSRSDIRMDDFLMTAPTFGDYAEFCSTVRMQSNIVGASVAMIDISSFADVFSGSTDVFSVSGAFSGIVDDFKLKGAVLRLTDRSFFAGSVEILDVTEPVSMFCAIDADSSRFYYEDIRGTSLIGESPFPTVYRQAFLSSLTWVEYRGNLTGYYNDFVSEGTVGVPAGAVSTDLKLTTTSGGGLMCNGSASAEDLQLSAFLSPAHLWGAVSGHISFTASVPRGSDYSFSANIGLSSLEFNQYQYSDLFLDATYADKKFEGRFSGDDPNLQIEIAGSVDVGDSVAKSKFAFNADRIGLSAVGLLPAEMLLSASCTGRIDAWMQTAEIFGVNTMFSSIDFESASGAVSDRNSVVQYLQGGNSKYFNLQSKYVNASVKGDFTADQLLSYSQAMVATVVPEAADMPDTLGRGVSLRARVFSDSLTRIASLLTPMPISCSKGFVLDAVLDSRDRAFNFNCRLPSMSIGRVLLEDIAVDATYTAGFITGEIIADIPAIRRDFPRTDITFSGDSTGIWSQVAWRSTDSARYRGSVTMEHRWMRHSESDSLQWHIGILPSELVFADTVYHVSAAQLMLMPDYLSVKDLNVRYRDRHLGVEGVFSRSAADTARVYAENIQLGSFNSVLSELGIILSGELSGSMSVVSAFDDPVFESQAGVDRFYFNTVGFGRIGIESQWDRADKKMNFSAQATKKQHQIISLSGSYRPENRYLDANTIIDSLDITFIDPFLEGVLGFKRGWVKGYGWIEGPIDSLTSTGQFTARDLVVRADYLNTTYAANGPFALKDGKLLFQGMMAADMRGGFGVVDGFFSLKALPALDFDILIKYNKLRSLNTQSADNDLFYGQVTSTGAVRLSDKDGSLYVSVAAQVQEGSKIFIPIASSGSESSGNLLRFVSDSSLSGVRPPSEDLVSVDLEINLTPDSEVQLIMDEQLGDIIKASGRGNVAISVDDKSEVSIMGEYRIEQGEYLFTMMNLINKRFKIESNSAIYFPGTLDDATVDLRAIYETKASVQPLMGADSSANYAKRTRTECVLWLTGNLFNPDIRFEVILPDQQGKVADKLLSLSDDERNRQFLSLLVLNRFSELEGASGTGSATSSGDGYVNSMEVLSNQFSNWLSGMSKDLDFGVNYRPGDAQKNLSDELELGVSAQIFNNRMTIDYSRSTNLGAETPAQQKSESNVGDVNVEIRLTDNGKLRLRGFSRSGSEGPMLENGAQTNGVGIVFTDEFDSFADLFSRRRKKREKEAPDSSANKQMYRKEEDSVVPPAP